MALTPSSSLYVESPADLASRFVLAFSIYFSKLRIRIREDPQNCLFMVKMQYRSVLRIRIRGIQIRIKMIRIRKTGTGTK